MRFAKFLLVIPAALFGGWGLLHAQKTYGRLPLARVMAPAIALAHDGLDVSREMATSFQSASIPYPPSSSGRTSFVFCGSFSLMR